MKIVSYEEILTNCGERINVELSALNEYLLKFENWKEIILTRHHQFIDLYIKGKYNLKFVKEETGFSVADLQSLFLRIQSQFEIYDESKEDIVFKDMYVDIYNLPVLTTNFKNVKKQEKEIEKTEEVFEQVEPQVDPNMLLLKITEKYQNFINSFEKQPTRMEKLQKLVELFKNYPDMELLKSIFVPNIYNSLCLLLAGKSLEETAEQLNLSSQYLLQLLSGAKKPRNSNEKGIIRIVNSYLKSL